MSQVFGIMVERISKVSATDGGSHVTLTFAMQDGKEATLVFPIGLCAGMMTSLISAAGLAQTERAKALGSSEASINFDGLSLFAPTGFEPGIVEGPAGKDVLLRLKKDQATVIDLLLSPDSAEQIARDLADHARLCRQAPSKLS